MEQLLSLFVRSIFVDNMIFAFFLGMCSYLAVSKNVKTAVGLGIAVTFVLVVTLPVNYLLQTKVLAANAIIEGVDLSFLSFILFIAVIAGIVQLVEMLVERFTVHAAENHDGSVEPAGHHRRGQCCGIRTRFRYWLVAGYRRSGRYPRKDGLL